LEALRARESCFRKKGADPVHAACRRRYHLGWSMTMSHYAFYCMDCNKEFTEDMHMSDFDHHQTTCPNCGSKRVSQRVEEFSAVTSKKS
jgi:putative FmdB family regulatory protein